MKNSYLPNYLKAIDKPLPQSKESFGAELKFLKQHINKEDIILDVGCGVARPAIDLAPFVKKLVAIENDKEMLDEAIKRCNKNNVELLNQDALNMKFGDNIFDLTYATYNLIGSEELGKQNIQKLVDEMKRVTKEGGKIINITWKDNKETTEFLKQYYPYIGIDIIRADETKTVTSKGVFERISKNKLLGYYNNASLKDIQFVEIGPIWLAIVGTK